MLDILRKKKEHWIGGLIVLAVVAVMAFVGVSSLQKAPFKGGPVSPNEPVAWINNEIIPQRDFSRELEFTLNQYRAVLGDKYDESLLTAFQVPQRTLERMIQYKLLCQQAEKMGFFIADQELADSIKSLPYFQKDGKFDASLYSKLPNRGLEERRQREQMAAKRLQDYLSSRIKSMPDATKNQLALTKTQVSLEFAEIDFNRLAPNLAPSEQLIQEIRSNDGALKSAYETRKKEFTQPARFKFRQIRAGTPFQANSEIRAKAKAKLEALKPQLNSSNFADLARSQSDDEFASRGGERDGLSTGASLDPTLTQALESLTPSQISPILETPSGYFIVQLLEKKPSEISSFDSVKNQLVLDLAKEKTKNEFMDSTRKKWESLLAAGKPLDSELSKVKVSLKKTGPFSLSAESIPQIGSSETLMDALFELSAAHPVAKRLLFHQDKYYYLKLLRVQPTPSPSDKKPETDTIVAQFQKELFENWMKSIEKQASIKISDSLKQKPGSRSTSL